MRREEGVKISAVLEEEEETIESIPFSQIVSWENVRGQDRLRLEVKAGALESSSRKTVADFGTLEADAIKKLLLETAQMAGPKRLVCKLDWGELKNTYSLFL